MPFRERFGGQCPNCGHYKIESTSWYDTYTETVTLPSSPKKATSFGAWMAIGLAMSTFNPISLIYIYLVVAWIYDGLSTGTGILLFSVIPVLGFFVGRHFYNEDKEMEGRPSQVVENKERLTSIDDRCQHCNWSHTYRYDK
jgi:hypothetical protein